VARRAHICKGRGGQSVGTRPLDRNDGAARPSRSWEKDPTRSHGTNPALRCPLLKSEMRAILMVVNETYSESNRFRWRSISPATNVVQQVLSGSLFDPNAPLLTVSARDSRKEVADRGYIQGSEGPGKVQPVFRIPIEDEIPGSRPKWKRPSRQLLDDPNRSSDAS